MNFEENQPNAGQASVLADRARRDWSTIKSWLLNKKIPPCKYEYRPAYDLRKNFEIRSCQLFYNICIANFRLILVNFKTEK